MSEKQLIKDIEIIEKEKENIEKEKELLKYEKEQIQNEKKENIKFKKINQNKTKKLQKKQNKINNNDDSIHLSIELENKKSIMASFSVFCISHFLIGQARQHLCQAIDALFELLAHHLADEEVEVGLDGQAHSALVVVLRKQLNPHVCCHGHPFGSELDGLLRLALYDAERGCSYRGVARNAVPVELQLS